ncbi:MAG: TolC family protein, partial [Planctomycetota bacterium]
MRHSSRSFGWRAVVVSAVLGVACHLSLEAQDNTTGESELPTHVIAIVRDGDSPYFDQVIRGFRAELEALAADQYRFELRETFNAKSNSSRVSEVLRSALSDPDVSVVYTAGFVSTFEAAGLAPAERTKPVVGGAVEFVDVSGERISTDGGSKLPNYTFIQSPRRVEADLERLKQLSGADTIYAIVDRFAFTTLEGIYRPQIDALSKKLGTTLIAVPRGETPEASVESLPADAKAVYVPILSSVKSEFRKELFERLTAKGILSLSILGVRDVEAGAFAGLARDNSSAVYRRMALNLHQILSGVPTSLLPVLLRADDQLVINMKTAAALGWSPDYETSLAAHLLYEDSLFAGTEEISLEGAMEMAERMHPDVAAAVARAQAEEFATRAVRGRFLPNLDVSGSGGANGVTERAVPALVPTPVNAHSFSVGVELRQLLFSDQLNTQLRAQKLVAEASRLEASSVRLDIIESAGQSFLDVLSAEALYEIEKENLRLIENNLQLAKLRRDVGAGEAVEIFRWEASRAQASSNLFQRDRDRRNARVQLNVSIGVDRNRHWKLRNIRLADDDFYFMNDAISDLVKDLATFRRFIQFLRSEARERAPEIVAFERNLKAQGYLLRERGRRNFLPQINATGTFQRVL